MSPDDTVQVDAVPDPDEEGELIRSVLAEEYEIVEELGRGGMAVVYRAVERALDREVAIKVLPLARTFDQEFVARFQREARLSASIEHPHIAPVYRVGRVGRVNFFVMKYMRGPSLSEIIADRRTLAPAEVETLLLEVGGALEHAHEQGIVHRDVKPDNIMKDQTGRYVIMDFGIAKSVSGTQLTQTGGSIGTPTYMSPEQAKGGELDGRSDFYSLGVVAYHCLVGRPPFEGEDPMSILFSHLHDSLPEPVLDSAEARRVYAVIQQLLAKDPNERLHRSADIEAGVTRTAPATTTHAGPPASGEPGPAAKVGEGLADGIPWLRGRRSGFWVSATVVASVLVMLIGRDGAAARCRAAMPDASADDRAVLLDAPGSVDRGAEIELSYVVCGVPDDQPFTSEVRIRPADGGGVIGRVGRFFGGGSDPFRESWNDDADGFATRRERIIEPSDLEPGSYRITLQMKGGDGQNAEASHDFTIVER